jgi:translocation and assembly module TamB
MVAGVSLASAALDVQSDSGRLDARLRATAKGSTLEMEGNANLLEAAPTFAAQGSLRHARPAVNQEGGDRRGTAHARFGLLGEGATLDSLDGSLWIEVDSVSWEGVVLEAGRLEMRASGGVLHLDTLSLESNAASLVGRGMLPVSSAQGPRGEVRLQGRVHQAEMFAGWVKAQSLAVAEATFSAEAAGTLEDMSLTGEAHLAGFRMDDLQLQELGLSAQGHRQGGEGFTWGSATLRIDGLQRGAFPLRSLETQASLDDGDVIAVSGSAVIDDSRDGTFAFRLEDLWDSPLLRIERFEFRADPDRWALQSPVRIHLQEGWEMDSLSIRSGSQEIRAKGRLARSGPLDLILAVQDFRIGTLSDLMGFPALQGRVTGSAAFAGEGESPRFTAGLQSRLESRNAPPSEVDLTASYADQAMNFQADVGMNGRRGLQARATLPFRLSLADTTTGFPEGEPLLLRLSAEDFPLAWVGPFLSEDMIRDLRGTLSGSVSLTGSREQPALDGALAVTDVEARLPALGVRYEQGRAQLRFQGETVLIDTLAVRTGDGSLSATGSVGIPGLESTDYDIRFVATDLRAVRSAGVDATVSGDIHVTGKSFEPAVTGNVVVRRADLYLDEMTSSPRVESVVLTEEDYQELARVFGYQERPRRRTPTRILGGLDLDLNLDLRRASWLRQRSNPEMAVQFSGTLSVQKEPGDSVLLVGEVTAVPARSYVEQFGRRFSLTRGNLMFQGAPGATLIDLRAEHEVPSRDNPDQPEVVIALDISGTPEDPRLELSSSPPLEASDMVSYLAVGRPADRTLGGGGSSLSQTGEALALGRLSGAVEAYAREEVGLDVVEIITDGTEGVVLLAGRYVSPDLYLGIRQPVSLHRTSGEASDRLSDPELEVEVQAIRWLLLNLQAGGRSGVELFVRSRISYE